MQNNIKLSSMYRELVFSKLAGYFDLLLQRKKKSPWAIKNTMFKNNLSSTQI